MEVNFLGLRRILFAGSVVTFVFAAILAVQQKLVLASTLRLREGRAWAFDTNLAKLVL